MSQTAAVNTVPLSKALDDGYGLASSDAVVRFVSSAHYVWTRIRMHAPFVIPAVVGMALIIMRAASRDRLGLTVVGLVIVMPIVLVYVTKEARQVVTSKGPQLCIVALPRDALRLLDEAGSYVVQDGGGRIPRYPLVASGNGVMLTPPRRHGGAVDTVPLRDRDVRVELECTKRGRLAGCVLSRDDQRTQLAVRGRLRLRSV